jgi:hypothetical protein
MTGVNHYQRGSWSCRPDVIAVLTGMAGLVCATCASAQAGTGVAGRFGFGFRHPFSAADHVLAVVSVGLRGAFLGRRPDLCVASDFPCRHGGGRGDGYVRYATTGRRVGHRSFRDSIGELNCIVFEGAGVNRIADRREFCDVPWLRAWQGAALGGRS